VAKDRRVERWQDERMRKKGCNLGDNGEGIFTIKARAEDSS
jgi:hypothetical protein